jgi:hypothetical protein
MIIAHILFDSLDGKGPFGDIFLDRRIILKCILKSKVCECELGSSGSR